LRRIVLVFAVALVALAVTASAIGGIYAGPWRWSSGQTAGSGWSDHWLQNAFATYGSGYDKTVTFIDNKSYGWHNTVRNRNQTTATFPPYPGTFKASCRANDSYFYGSCTVW
jgi:hypothetical protein